ncbi:MAG: hypothetical protein AAGJ95_16240, partial [Cyanobacteria bacterium J06554_11]
YTFASGSTASAISIDNGVFQLLNGEPYTERPSVTGLECVIEPEVESSYQPLLNCQYFVTHNTQITLKQWDISSTTQTARSLLLQGLGGLIDEIGPRIRRNTVLDSIESQSFVVSIPGNS